MFITCSCSLQAMLTFLALLLVHSPTCLCLAHIHSVHHQQRHSYQNGAGQKLMAHQPAHTMLAPSNQGHACDNNPIFGLPTVHLATVATDNRGYHSWLLASAARHNTALTVLGAGERWQGYNQKLAMLLPWMAQLPPRDIVCYVDGYDSIVLRPVQELAEPFVRMQAATGAKVIASTEKEVNWGLMMAMRYLFGTCKGQALNAGSWCAYAEHALAVMNSTLALDPRLSTNDQMLLVKYCHLHPDEVWVDADSQLMLGICKPFFSVEKDVTITHDGQLWYQGHRPFIFHAPGNTFMHNTIQKLGYTIIPDDLKAIRSYMLGQFIRDKVLHYGPKVARHLAILGLCLACCYQLWKKARHGSIHGLAQIKQ